MYQEVMRNENISVEAKAIYAYLSSIAGVGSTCYPSVDTMCRDLRMSRNRLSKHLNQLIALGVVEKTRVKAGNILGGNLYKVTHEIAISEDMKRIFEALENEALENEALENDTTNNNSINNNNINNNSINTFSPEPDKSAPVGSGILLPLVDKTMYDVPVDKIKEWKQAFPGVDVEQELRKMITWLNSNPTRGKTRRGIARFINSWLERSQNQGGWYRSRQIAPETKGNTLPYDDVLDVSQYGKGFVAPLPNCDDEEPWLPD